MDDLTKIYALRDPTNNLVFYIGRTDRSLVRRFVSHLGEVNATSNANFNWKKIRYIDSLMQRGIIPIFELVEWVNFYDGGWYNSLHPREDYWIKYYIKRGHPITNSVKRGGKINKLMKSLDDSPNHLVERKYITLCRMEGYEEWAKMAYPKATPLP